jgi:hypothetical protein
VKCDGAKPACSSCVKTAKWKREPIQCVYRADLYVQQCRDEEMRQRMGASDVKTEDSDDVCCPPEPAADMSSSTSSLEAMQPDEPQCCPSTRKPRVCSGAKAIVVLLMTRASANSCWGPDCPAGYSAATATSATSARLAHTRPSDERDHSDERRRPDNGHVFVVVDAKFSSSPRR